MRPAAAQGRAGSLEGGTGQLNRRWLQKHVIAEVERLEVPSEHGGGQTAQAAAPQGILGPTHGPVTCCLLGSGSMQDSHPKFPRVTWVRSFSVRWGLLTGTPPSTKPCASSFALKDKLQPSSRSPNHFSVRPSYGAWMQGLFGNSLGNLRELMS